MKKPTRKLVLSRETVRTLAAVDLKRVAGALVSGSDDRAGCVAAEAQPSLPSVGNADG